MVWGAPWTSSRLRGVSPQTVRVLLIANGAHGSIGVNATVLNSVVSVTGSVRATLRFIPRAVGVHVLL